MRVGRAARKAMPQAHSNGYMTLPTTGRVRSYSYNPSALLSVKGDLILKILHAIMHIIIMTITISCSLCCYAILAWVTFPVGCLLLCGCL